MACAGGGYASHAEVIFVPKNLCCEVARGCFTGSRLLHDRRMRSRFKACARPIRGWAKRSRSSGLGLVGQLTVQLLKAAGCQVLGVDIDPAACDLAKKSGADIRCK